MSSAQEQQPDDMARMAELWTQAHPIVAAFIRSVVHDFHDSADVLQQTAQTVATRFGDYEPERPFPSWALGIARFKVLEYRRRKGRELPLFGSDTLDKIVAAHEAEAPLDLERREALEHCRERLTERARHLLEFRYARDLKPREIAEHLTLSANAVRVMLHRVRAALERCIEQRLAGEPSS